MRTSRAAVRSVGTSLAILAAAVGAASVVASRGDAAAGPSDGGPPAAGTVAAVAQPAQPAQPMQDRAEQVRRGRLSTISHGCADCHGGGPNPAADGYLAGMKTPEQEFLIGPCATKPGATPCFRTRPRNLTPDNTTGLGRFSERQIFNALRYGLRPGETPDVEITSTTPGQGNFPQNPKYLAPPMPWPAFRHIPDQELRDIAAYLKHGVKPVRNRVPDSDGPPDFWASEYTPQKIGTYPAPAFPTANEKLPQ